MVDGAYSSVFVVLQTTLVKNIHKTRHNCFSFLSLSTASEDHLSLVSQTFLCVSNSVSMVLISFLDLGLFAYLVVWVYFQPVVSVAHSRFNRQLCIITFLQIVCIFGLQCSKLHVMLNCSLECLVRMYLLSGHLSSLMKVIIQKTMIVHGCEISYSYFIGHHTVRDASKLLIQLPKVQIFLTFEKC